MPITLDRYKTLSKIPSPGSKRDRFRCLRSKIPAGASGDWRVERFTVERDLALMRLMRDGRGTPPGEYTRLCHRLRGVIMSDTDAELEDLSEFLWRVRGRVLIHGLGLGIAVCGALADQHVTHVDVVEMESDVISLVGNHIHDERLVIHHGDCLTKKWAKDATWDIVWHDIWDNICGDNKPVMRKLRRRFAGRCEWQGCWAERLCRD